MRRNKFLSMIVADVFLYWHCVNKRTHTCMWSHLLIIIYIGLLIITSWLLFSFLPKLL